MVARALLSEMTFGTAASRERPLGIHIPYTRLGRFFNAAGNARIPFTPMLSINERIAARRMARVQKAVAGYRDTGTQASSGRTRESPDQHRLANQLRQPI